MAKADKSNQQDDTIDLALVHSPAALGLRNSIGGQGRPSLSILPQKVEDERTEWQREFPWD